MGKPSLPVRRREVASVPAPASMLGTPVDVAIIALCEFFAAAQPMIMPLAPKGTNAAEFAQQYERFIRELLLGGVRSKLKPARASRGRPVSRSRPAPR